MVPTASVEKILSIRVLDTGLIVWEMLFGEFEQENKSDPVGQRSLSLIIFYKINVKVPHL